NVVVAGRVSVGAAVEDCVWVVVELCPVDVPEGPDCALAVPATASARAQANATRLAMVGRLRCHRSGRRLGELTRHDPRSPPGAPGLGLLLMRTVWECCRVSAPSGRARRG